MDNSANTVLSVAASLSVSPTRGVEGTLVTFTAVGFAGGSAITIAWSGGTVCSGATAADGSYSCAITMPSTGPGPYTFTATDAAENSAGTSFTVIPVLAVSPVPGLSDRASN